MTVENDVMSKSREIRITNHPDRQALRKSERTRLAILEAVEQLVWNHAFRDLDVARVMEVVGASRPTFYSYFADLHAPMEELLREIQEEIMEGARPWFEDAGDPIPLLEVSLRNLVEICYRKGPILRAVFEATATDAELERIWNGFIAGFDQVVSQRIEQHQAQGLIKDFPAAPVAFALNRMDAAVLIAAFGREPRAKPDSIYESISRIWISTLY